MDAMPDIGLDPVQALGLLDDEAIRLDEAALALAAADRPPGPDTEAELLAGRLLLDRLQRRLASRAGRMAGSAAAASALATVLYREEGFSGDPARLNDPTMADVLHCLGDRRGMPVTLAIIHVALARRMGWEAHVLGVPGHVVIAIGHEGERLLLDPWDPETPLGAPALSRLAQAHGVRLPAGGWLPMSNREILVRLLSNQAIRARRASDLPRAQLLFRRMTALAPGMTHLWWELARLERLLGDIVAARRALASMRETTREPAVLGRIRAAEEALTR